MPNTSRPPAGRFLYRVRLCYHLDGAGDFRRIADYGLRGPTGFARENLRGAQAWAIDKVAALAGGTSFWLRTLRPAAYECLGPLLARLAGGTYSIFGSFDAAGGPAPKPGEEVQATFEGLIWSDQAGVELLAAGVLADLCDPSQSPHLTNEMLSVREGAADLLVSFTPPVYDGGAKELIEAFGAEISPAFDAFARAVGDKGATPMRDRPRPSWLPSMS